MKAITSDEWLVALNQAGASYVTDPIDPRAITMKEFAAKVGVSRSHAENLMRLLVDKGLAVRRRKLVERSGAAPYPAPAYLLKEAGDVGCTDRGVERPARRDRHAPAQRSRNRR